MIPIWNGTMIPTRNSRYSPVPRRPSRRAIAYAHTDPITISAITLPTVMIRLLTSAEPRVSPATPSHAVE